MQTNTWTSLGVLYAQQKQHMDAIHSFVCALHCDARNKSAWLNLGVIYERAERWEDALTCYKCALMALTGLDDVERLVTLDLDSILNLYNQKINRKLLLIPNNFHQ